MTVVRIVIGALSSHQRIGQGIGEFWKNTASGNHPTYSIVEIGQNTKKNLGDLRRLAVT